MTLHYTPIPVGSAGNASVFNAPLAQLDASIDDALTFSLSNNAELVAARSPYPSLDARLDALVVAGSNVSTLANGAANAGQKVVTVDSTTGFLENAPIIYTLVGGVVENNTIDTIDSPTQLTLVTNIGSGGIADNTFIMVVPPGTSLSATGMMTGASAQIQTFALGVEIPTAGKIQLSGVTVPTAPTVALGSAGVLNGACVYQVTYYTATGETGLSANSSQITPSSQKVNVTIPVSPDGAVTGRKLWRSKVGDTTRTYLVVDIGNNVTTTYEDNTADNSLGMESHYLFSSLGTSPSIWSDAKRIFRDTGLNLCMGNDTGLDLAAGAYYNILAGNGAGRFVTTGCYNTFIGGGAGYSNTTASGNTLLGMKAGFYNVDGGANTIIGGYASYFLAGGTGNVCVGYASGDTAVEANANVTGDYNVFIGQQAGPGSPTQINNSIAIGYQTTVLTSNTVKIGNASTLYNYFTNGLYSVGAVAGLYVDDRTGGETFRWSVFSDQVSAEDTLQFRNIGGALTVLSLNRTGKVGIMTTAPASRLDIDAGAMTMKEMTAPSAPAANSVVIYAVDNGGKTALMALFPTGVAKQIEIES